jgi:hypothetical protein
VSLADRRPGDLGGRASPWTLQITAPSGPEAKIFTAS